MCPEVDAAAFERGIADLDTEEFAGFVAAVHAAREGVESVEREGGVLVVGGRETRRILPVADRRGPFRPPVPVGTATGPVDEVVAQVDGDDARAVAARHDARYRSPADLYARVRYGLAPGVGDRLIDDHLDVRAATGDGSAPRGRAAAVLGLAALVVVAALAATAVPLGSSPGTSSGTTTASPSRPGSDAVPTRSPADPYPPGVDAGGVRDAEALSRAHADAVRARSHRWTVVAGRTGANWAGIDVEATGPRAVLRAAGDGPPNATGDGTFRSYSDGNYSYTGVTGPNGTRYVRESVRRRPGADGRYADRAAGYVARYLSGDAGEVAPLDAAGLRVYRLTVMHPPDGLDGSVTDYLATAVVTRQGFVVALDVGYRRYGTGNVTAVAVRFRYGPYSGTPEPAPWVDAARAATDGPRPTASGDGD